MKGRKDSFDFYLTNERHKQQGILDSDEWFNDDMSEQPSTRDRPQPERYVRPNASTAHSRDHQSQVENTTHRRTNSEDNIADFSSTENSYSLLSFLVKLLLHRESLPLEDILDHVQVAYDNLGGKKGKHRSMIRSKVTELLKVSSLFFRATDTTHWALVDKAKAVSHLAEVKEGVSKHSETASLSMETATVNGQPGSQLKGTSDSNSQKQTSRKRKYKRSLEKYQSVVQNLDSLCDEYKKVLKNPFASMPEKRADFNTQESHLEELVKCLGSTEKIMGILQCYNYFSPIIQTGLKRMNDREDTSQIKKNMVEMSQKMLEFVDFAKTIQDEKDKLKFERNCVTALGKRKRKSSGVLDSGDATKPGEIPVNIFEIGDGSKRVPRGLADDPKPEPRDTPPNLEKRPTSAFHRHASEENPILKKLKVDSSIRVGDLKSGWLLRTFEDPKIFNASEIAEADNSEATPEEANRKRMGSFDLEQQLKGSSVGLSPFSKLRPQDSSQKLTWGGAEASGQKEKARPVGTHTKDEHDGAESANEDYCALKVADQTAVREAREPEGTGDRAPA